MDESRITALEFRVARLETERSDAQAKPTKNDHIVFQCPDDTPKEIYDNLVNLRRQFVKETGKNALNLIMNGKKIADIINSKPSSVEDLRKIVGLGEKFIREFGVRILDVLNPVPDSTPTPVSVPPEPSTMTKEQTKDMVVKSKKTKPQKQIFP